MDTTASTARRISAAVEAAGVTRKALSETTGIAYTTLFRVLNGHTPADVEQIASIAGALNVSAQSLVSFGDAQ